MEFSFIFKAHNANMLINKSLEKKESLLGILRKRCLQILSDYDDVKIGS